LSGDCGFYINEIEGMYLNVIGRNLLKLYHERNIILAQSNVL
jgi:predicted house-cleaning NTP pyrophosphatase (Maf/HAM1 superfamily)